MRSALLTTINSDQLLPVLPDWHAALPVIKTSRSSDSWQHHLNPIEIPIKQFRQFKRSSSSSLAWRVYKSNKNLFSPLKFKLEAQTTQNSDAALMLVVFLLSHDEHYKFSRLFRGKITWWDGKQKETSLKIFFLDIFPGRRRWKGEVKKAMRRKWDEGKFIDMALWHRRVCVCLKFSDKIFYT